MPSKKHIKYLKNEKNQKFIWDAYPMEFAGSTQNHKKIIGTSNLPKSKRKMPQKTMFRTLIVEENQKFVLELPNGICRLNP
jgi:hypothetical protein